MSLMDSLKNDFGNARYQSQRFHTHVVGKPLVLLLQRDIKTLQLNV